MENEYYVYAYLDPREKGQFIYNGIEYKYKPFYIGKGKNDRCYRHLIQVKNKNKYKDSKKYKTIREILYSDMEPIIIKIKENLKELESLKLERKTIKKIGLDILTNENYGGIHVQEGYKHTEETKKKLSVSGKGRVNKNFILISPDNKRYENVCLSDFCRKNELNFHKLRKFVNRGKIKLNNSGFSPKQETINCNGWEVIRDDIPIIEKYKYVLVDPNGKEYKFNKIHLFCNEYNLDIRTISRNRNNGKIKIIKKRTNKVEVLNCENWEFINYEKDGRIKSWESIVPIKWKAISPNGEITFINNISKFCNENNLSYFTFLKNINKGKISKKLRENHKIINVVNSINWEILDIS